MQFNFDRLNEWAQSKPPLAAADALIADLDDGRDPSALFYAHLLRGRLELGVSPYPTGGDLPAKHHEAYEHTIRTAAQTVGSKLISQRELAKAWPFYRLINEPAPMRQALESYEPGDEEDLYPLIDIAFHQGVAPERGFEWMLTKQGICATITLLAQTDLSKSPELRENCFVKLTDALTRQLTDRLRGDLQSRGVAGQESATVGELLTRHPELTDHDAYHIDLSHLQSVIQMGMVLNSDTALSQLVDLCEYGCRLGSQFQFSTDPPFDEGYPDYRAYYETRLGRNVDVHVSRFEAKAKMAMDEGMTYPCHVLVELLGRIGRDADALAVAKRLMAGHNPAEIGGPNLIDLAKKVGDHSAVADAARQINDPVTFLAARLSQ